MGLGATRLLTRHEEEFEEQQRVLNPKAFNSLEFFLEWNLADIAYARSRWEETGGPGGGPLPPAAAAAQPASSPRKKDQEVQPPPITRCKTRWEQFYLVSYEVKERHQQVMDEVEMRAWHPACSGFVMRKDDTAEDLYAEYQLGDLFRPKTGNHRHDYHTDDEKSEDEEEEEGDGTEKEDDDEGDDETGLDEAKGESTEGESSDNAAMADANNPNEPPMPNLLGGGDPMDDALYGDPLMDAAGAEAPAAASAEGVDTATTVSSITAAPTVPAVEEPAAKEEAAATAEEPPPVDPEAAFKPPPRPPSPDVEVTRRPLPEAFDPAKRSPIFFGYLGTSVEDQIRERAGALSKAEGKEVDAMARLRKKRQIKVEKVTKEAEEKRRQREMRMDYVKQQHAKKLAEREKERREAEKFFKPEEYKQFIGAFQRDSEAILAANAAELAKMKRVSEEKFAADEVEIKAMEAQLKAYDDLQSMKRPQGPMLVETARDELKNAAEELRERMHVLREVQRDLKSLREEMKDADDTLALQARSLQITVEGRLMEERRRVEGLLQEMDDAEVVLHRAVARKTKEEKILPLFERLCSSDEDGDYLNVLELVTGLVLMNSPEPFSEKIRYLLSLFDYDGNGFVSQLELVELLHTVFTFLEHVGFARLHVDREETESLVARVFFMEKIDARQGMTSYEAKAWLRNLVGRSRALCTLLNCTWENGELSTYQRQKMQAVHQFELGMLTLTDLKYHLAKAMLTCRPLLTSEAKVTIHERAMAKGADDPLKPDYSRFVAKKMKQGSYKVVALVHGHLGSVVEWRRVQSDKAATMLQAVYRGIRGRRLAEQRAMVVAFLTAQETAMERMREKVRKDVLRQDANIGMEKLKFDAKVRNRAAKMKAQGLPSEREDVIAAIIREGVEAGEKEVRIRFREIAKEKGFEDQLDEEEKEKATKSEEAVKAQYIDVAASMAEHAAKAKEILENKAKVEESAADQEVERPDAYINLPGLQDRLSREEEEKRRDAIIKGRHPPDLFRTGETFSEQFLRFRMASPDVSSDDLYQRLRSLDSALTLLKCRELMMELPSKRLLLQLVDRTSRYVLPHELATHFRMVHGYEVVSEILRDVLSSDLEWGVITAEARGFYQGLHAVLEKQWQATLDKGLKRAGDMLLKASKSGAMATLSIEEKVKQLVEREMVNVHKKTEQLAMNQDNLRKVMKKMNNARSALDELGRRLKDIDRFVIVKVRQDSIIEEVPLPMRVDWYRRYAAALAWPEDSPQAVKSKYTEISNVTHEFLHAAGRLSAVIVNELYLPIEQKSIRPAAETPCDGRAAEGGRGVDGVRYKYEAWNIRFKVLVDDHGIFNGSDEHAGKAGGAERRNSLELLKQYVPGLGVPLIATVDYHGFRVLATAKMPVEMVRFNESGDVRGRREEFVFGTKNRGETFVDSEKKLTAMLEQVSKKLNLSRHNIKCFRDVNSRSIWGSADLRGFRAEDGSFLLLNFWRVMPPEHPHVSEHLISAPRDMSMFYRFLRPEFVRRQPAPLSPDANLLITNGTPDCQQQLDGLRDASLMLVTRTIADFADYLASQPAKAPAWQGFGIDITNNLHRYGINARHLGLIRSYFWRRLGATANLIFNSKRIVTQGDLRLEVVRGAQLRIKGVMYRVSTNPKDEFAAKAVTLTDKVREMSDNYCDVYAGEVSDDRNSEQVRLLLLAEIVARTTKNLVRSYLRMVMKVMKTSAEYIQVALIVEFLNVLTGSHPRASDFWSEQLYHAAVVRYGHLAISFVERPNLRHIISPAVIYVVQRLQDMLGFRVSGECLAHFHKNPRSFRFTSGDIQTPVIRLKHNVPLMDFADAVLLNLQADAISTKTYTAHVSSDRPLLYWHCGERRGSRLAFNYGSLGTPASGSYHTAVIFEAQGPIKNEETNRAVRLRASEMARIDTTHLAELAPTSAEQPFTVEVWARVLGCWDINRVLLMNSRYCILATRDNRWAFQVFAKYVSATITGPPIERDAWAHLVCTYDGTVARLYVNSLFVQAVELAEELEKQLDALRQSRQEAYDRLEREERAAKDGCWKKVEEDSNHWFKTKEGRNHLRKASLKLLEQAEYRARIAMQQAAEDDAPHAKVVKRMTKDEAVQLSMQAYRNEEYGKRVHDLNNHYRRQRELLMGNHKKEDLEAELKLTTILRVGGTGPNKATNTGSLFFDGEVCHLAIYDKALSHDRVQAHYMSGTQERSIECERLYALAAEKYAEALRFAPDDPVLLRKYAESVCNFVMTDGARQVNERRTKNKVAHAIELFRSLENYDAMAEMLRRLPNEFGFSDTACVLFNTIVAGRPDYFSTSDYFTRKDLALIPNRFLLYESTDTQQVETAAAMFQEVMQDPGLALFYGDDDLTFIRKLRNPKVILTVVKQVRQGVDKRVMDVNAYRDCTDMDDDDMRVLADYRRAAIAMTLRNCAKLTDASIKDMARYCIQLQAITLDGCPQVTNESLQAIKRYCQNLSLLSLEGCVRVTDVGLLNLLDPSPPPTSSALSPSRAGGGPSKLRVLNLSGCSQFSDVILSKIAACCPELELLHLAHCFLLTDPGILTFTSGVNANTMASLDLSACKGLTDGGFELVGRALHSLTYLNVSSARMTDTGMRAITHGCWKLRSLIMRDLYLVSDDVFHFDAENDGRRSVDENMLMALTELDVTDCTRLTDRAVAAVSTRCPHMAVLRLGGCSNLTDKSLQYLLHEPRHNKPRGQDLVRVDLAFCIQLTNEGIEAMCQACEKLEALDLSGCVHLTDEVIAAVAKYCPHLQRLSLARCKRLTDRALCTLADYLWIEELDVSHCNKVTDEGIEVAAVEFQGLKKLSMAWCYRLTERSLRVLARNCAALQELNVAECSGIRPTAVDELQVEMPRLKIIRAMGQQSRDEAGGRRVELPLPAPPAV